MNKMRGEVFEEDQVWSTPRGYLYKVVSVKQEDGQKPVARLRSGDDGKGRMIKRNWDQVNNWTLERDS